MIMRMYFGPRNVVGLAYNRLLSQAQCAEQGRGFSWLAHTICRQDRLDEESGEKINNY